MAIKKPTINKPGAPKINTGIKKPNMKPVVSDDIKTPPELTHEEVVVEPIVILEETPEDIAPELLEQMIEEENQKLEEQDALEEIEIPEDVIVKNEEPVIEEVKEEIIEEPVVEEKPKKKSSKKKSSSKKSSNKEEKVEKEQPVELEETNYKSQNISDAWKEMILATECTTPEWEERKKVIKEQVEAMHIDPDSTPAEMRYLIADIDAALSQLKIYKIETDQVCNSLLKQINYVSLQAGSKGSNSEERKANAIKGLIFYRRNPEVEEYTNLLELQTYAENQIAFYDEMIKILVDKKNMLITFSGIVKTESQLGSY